MTIEKRLGERTQEQLQFLTKHQQPIDRSNESIFDRVIVPFACNELHRKERS